MLYSSCRVEVMVFSRPLNHPLQLICFLGSDRELKNDEFPLLVQHGWSDQSSCRFEFQQRTAQGGAIKVYLFSSFNFRKRFIDRERNTFPLPPVFGLRFKVRSYLSMPSRIYPVL